MKHNKLSGVIFDWAGTTVDYGCFAPLDAFLTVFAEHGVPVTVAEARAPMGRLKKDHIRALLTLERVAATWKKERGRLPGAADVESLYQAFEPALFRRLPEFATPIPDVPATIAELRHRGLKIGSTTGYTRAMIEVVAAGAAAAGYVPDAIVCSDECRAGRPRPWMIYRNCELLDLGPLATVVKVGDTIADVEEGVNASVWSVGVCRGSSLMGLGESEEQALTEVERRRRYSICRAAMLDAGADFVIDHFGRLPELLDDIERLLVAGERPGGRRW
ncbi:MAG: phosphonoacetaldehyde hydrolase [Deltaproteobacteria bacterium]|nr:phosphonoacetaldehyde hydrolase [Deltaproteobacteria bacterium]